MLARGSSCSKSCAYLPGSTAHSPWARWLGSEFSAYSAEGKPTGRTELRYGKDGEAGYLRWLAANHPGYFAALYGKLLRLEVNQKTEEKPVVRYETVEERRAAMLAKGWAPSALAALEEAMERSSCETCARRRRARCRARLSMSWRLHTMSEMNRREFAVAGLAMCRHERD